MDDRLIPIQGTFRSNEGLFRAALDGLGAPEREVWLARSGEANHLAFLGLHLVGARYYIVKFLGGSSADPLGRYHEKARTIDEIDEFPPPAEVLAAWNDVAPALDAVLSSASAEHLGQMCLIRRIHGMPAAEWPCF